MTYAEFLNEAASVAMLHKEWRWGQTLYNVLHIAHPNLTAYLLCDPDIDPYYDDSKVPAFLDWLEENWNSSPPTAGFVPKPR